MLALRPCRVRVQLASRLLAEQVHTTAPESMAFVLAGFFTALSVDRAAWDAVVTAVLTEETCTEEVLLLTMALLGAQEAPEDVERIQAIEALLCERRGWGVNRCRGATKLKSRSRAQRAPDGRSSGGALTIVRLHLCLLGSERRF